MRSFGTKTHLSYFSSSLAIISMRKIWVANKVATLGDSKVPYTLWSMTLAWQVFVLHIELGKCVGKEIKCVHQGLSFHACGKMLRFILPSANLEEG